MKYRAILNTNASCTVQFEAPEGANQAELLAALDDVDTPTLCHHCSGKSDLTLGDDWDVDSFGGKLQIYPDEE